MRALTSIFCWIFFFYLASGQETLTAEPSFRVKDGSIAAINGPLFNNRPLYCNHSDAFILAGDRPFVHFAKTPFVFGGFGIAVGQGERWKWLHEFEELTSLYRAGRMTWKMSDPGFPGMLLVMDVVPMAGATGMAVRIQTESSVPDCRLAWIYGGAQRSEEILSWYYDPLVNEEMLSWKMAPEACTENIIRISGNGFSLELEENDRSDGDSPMKLIGQCNRDHDLAAGEASEWESIPDLMNSSPGDHPLVYGIIRIDRDEEVYWSFQSVDDAGEDSLPSPKSVFDKGLTYAKSLEERIVVSTPDPWLNALASTSVASIDGLWYPPVYRHGAMLWNRRYPGWRTLIGGTMYGWHDRVREQAAFYLESQVKESNKLEPKPDPSLLLTAQHKDSRFYGKGRILLDQSLYNMQSQFFDQLIRGWRWSADPELEKILWPALELHLEWQRDCFDPNNDGTYESYINSWPTDSQWYNGGETAEETSYAFTGHMAALDMAQRAGDTASVSQHRKQINKIRKGFFENLWISEYGHSGSYKEQGGYQRLHTDPWLYSIFLPVDAGLLNRQQVVESLYYSEWALQNDRMPLGGRKVWTSNWVPGVWSVRPLWPGDNYHLALAYFKAGLQEEAWDIFRGVFLHSAYGHRIPGNLGDPVGGTDFGDCTHMFCRTLVEGLFGYMPDLPAGIVKIAPQFPGEWDSAAIHTPDFEMEYRKNDREIHFHLTQNHPADLDIRIPVTARSVQSVRVDGEEVAWELLPGFGQTLVHITLYQKSGANLVLLLEDPCKPDPTVYIEGKIQEKLSFPGGTYKIKQVLDPQGILSSLSIGEDRFQAILNGKAGFHTVLAEVEAGNKMPKYQIFRLRILDPVGDSLKNEKIIWQISEDVNWEMIDLAERFNGDVRTIYKQAYLSPRPNTVSVRIGSDGYSPWTFPYWRSYPPDITLDSVSLYMDSGDRLVTESKIPFLWNNHQQNVIFTSLWDNWPDRVMIPVDRKGEAISFLVCGSTNPMQCQIPNAVLRLRYEDGSKEELELVPPVNYLNISPILSEATAPGQTARSDYDAKLDAFCMPKIPPETIQLGKNCRAMVLKWKLRPGIKLVDLEFETLSQEVVVGLMGISILNPGSKNQIQDPGSGMGFREK